MWILPPRNTRSSRLTFSGSPGRFATSTSWPVPVNAPVATNTLLRRVRVPDSPDATIVPRIDSLPLVRAAAGATAATNVSTTANTAAGAELTWRFIASPSRRGWMTPPAARRSAHPEYPNDATCGPPGLPPSMPDERAGRVPVLVRSAVLPPPSRCCSC